MTEISARSTTQAENFIPIDTQDKNRPRVFIAFRRFSQTIENNYKNRLVNRLVNSIVLTCLKTLQHNC